MMPKIHLKSTRPWGVGDAILFWFRSVGQWIWRPLRRGVVLAFYYGVSPPVMIFPDSKGATRQFPPPSSLRFHIECGHALQLWTADDLDTPTEPDCSFLNLAHVKKIRH